MFERIASNFWPRSAQRAVPYLMLLPAVLLVGLLVIGLVQIGDSSMRTLDTSTFRMSENYTLANYHALSARGSLRWSRDGAWSGRSRSRS